MSKKDKDKSKDSGRLDRKTYEKELRKLQVELCHLQDWVKDKRRARHRRVRGPRRRRQGRHHQGDHRAGQPARVPGRGAAGAVGPREDADVHAALHASTSRPAGEIVIFDRSWYNRAGVEYVMGFCTPRAAPALPGALPDVREASSSTAASILIKIWLEVGQEEQERRFEARIDDPLRQWKLSPMDVESYARWYDYSRARDLMLEATDTDARALAHRPLRRQEARAAELHLAHPAQIPYKKVEREKVKLPKRVTRTRTTTPRR